MSIGFTHRRTAPTAGSSTSYVAEPNPHRWTRPRESSSTPSSVSPSSPQLARRFPAIDQVALGASVVDVIKTSAEAISCAYAHDTLARLRRTRASVVIAIPGNSTEALTSDACPWALPYIALVDVEEASTADPGRRAQAPRRLGSDKAPGLSVFVARYGDGTNAW